MFVYWYADSHLVILNIEVEAVSALMSVWTVKSLSCTYAYAHLTSTGLQGITVWTVEYIVGPRTTPQTTSEPLTQVWIRGRASPLVILTLLMAAVRGPPQSSHCCVAGCTYNHISAFLHELNSTRVHLMPGYLRMNAYYITNMLCFIYLYH